MIRVVDQAIEDQLKKLFLANRFVNWGLQLIALCMLGMAIGKFLVELLDLGGPELSSFGLWYLISIYSIGASGVLVVMVGYWLQPRTDTKLKFSFAERDDRMFSPGMGCIIKGLSSFVGVFFVAAGLVWFHNDSEPISRYARWSFSYCILTYGLMIIYLCWFYRSDRNKLTTTFYNNITAPIGFFLSPVFLPMMIFLSLFKERDPEYDALFSELASQLGILIKLYQLCEPDIDEIKSDADGFPEYPASIQTFMSKLSNSFWLHSKYSKFRRDKLAKKIHELNLEQVMVLFTYIARSEKWVTGEWAYYLQSGIVELNLDRAHSLIRLKTN